MISCVEFVPLQLVGFLYIPRCIYSDGDDICDATFINNSISGFTFFNMHVVTVIMQVTQLSSLIIPVTVLSKQVPYQLQLMHLDATVITNISLKV